VLDSGLEAGLEQGGREVTPGALEDGAEGVGRSPQATADRVGVVHRDEQAVGLVHGRQERLGPGQVPFSQAVEQVAAQLAGRLGQAVEPGRGRNVELSGGRQGEVGHEGGGQAGLGVLLGRIVQRAAAGQGRERREGVLGLA